MAHLWREQTVAASSEPQWVTQGLDGESAVPVPDGGVYAAAALLLRSRSAEGDQWLLMPAGRGDVSVNGTPLRTGIRVLADRDEIRVAGGGRMFFSTERLAAVEIFRGAERRIDCARCRLEVVAGTPVVVCPRCARVFHECAEQELPCWSHSSRCVCPQPTAAAEYQWTPEGL